MIQNKGSWSPELQRELEATATQTQTQQLEQTAQELGQQQTALGIASVTPEVAPGVPADNF